MARLTIIGWWVIIVFHVITSISDLEIIYIKVHHNPNIPITIFLVSNRNHASHWNPGIHKASIPNSCVILAHVTLFFP